MTKLLVGLGNPGEKYRNSRHNTGFIVLDAFVHAQGLSWTTNKKVLSEICREKEVVLLKPQTFMNDSGQAVSKALSYFSVLPEDLIVVHDEVDLEPLQLRVSKDASSAGHRGVQSIIDWVGTQDFTRIRVGVGRPRRLQGTPAENNQQVEKYVLEDFLPDELEAVKKLGIEHLLSSLKV